MLCVHDHTQGRAGWCCCHKAGKGTAGTCAQASVPLCATTTPRCLPKRLRYETSREERRRAAEGCESRQFSTGPGRKNRNGNVPPDTRPSFFTHTHSALLTISAHICPLPAPVCQPAVSSTSLRQRWSPAQATRQNPFDPMRGREQQRPRGPRRQALQHREVQNRFYCKMEPTPNERQGRGARTPALSSQPLHSASRHLMSPSVAESPSPRAASEPRGQHTSAHWTPITRGFAWPPKTPRKAGPHLCGR